MAEIAAYFQTASGGPLVGPTGVDIPEVLIARTPGNTVAQAAIDMLEVTNAPGWYTFTFPTVDGEEYVWIADGDPAGSGQLPATARFDRGVISGTTVARSEVDVPAILVDTATGVAVADDELSDIHTYLGLKSVSPRVDTPASIDAGGISQTVGVVGTTVTTTRT